MSRISEIVDRVLAPWRAAAKTESPNGLGGMGIKDSNPLLRKMFGWSAESDSLTSPYSQIPIIYASIRAVEKVLAQTEWQLFRGERLMDDRDPMYRLLATPNIRQSAYDARMTMGSNLQLRGNTYAVKSQEMSGGLPAALYFWPSSYFTPKYTQAGAWVGWMVKRGKEAPQFYPPERVIHVPTFNPSDEMMGLAPLDVLKQSYSALWEAVVYNRKFFRNDGTPPIIYKIPQGFRDDRERNMFHKEIKERAGEKKAHTAQVLEGEVETTVVGFSQKDMMFLELLKYFSDDALMVFGVPKTQVSKYEDVNYATALAQDKIFITTTCIPLMTQIASKFNSQWLTALGYSLRFDVRSNPAMTSISDDEATKVVALTGRPVLTQNEGRKMLGLEPMPWGDEAPETGAASFTPQPAPSTRAVEPTVAVEKGDDELRREQKEKAVLEEEMAKAQRTNTWHALNAKISPTVKKAELDFRKYFHSIEVRALARASAKAFEPELLKASEPVIDDLFDDAKLERLADKYLRASLGLGAGTLDVEINLDAPDVVAYLGNRTQYMKGINDDARAKLRETLTQVLRDAMDQQMTEEQRTAAIVDAFKADFSALKSRARSIARTEVHSAFSDGRWEGAKELNPKQIEWISSRDALVRDSHRRLDGKLATFGESFENGCRYPLDPRGRAGEICNCRCNFALKF